MRKALKELGLGTINHFVGNVNISKTVYKNNVLYIAICVINLYCQNRYICDHVWIYLKHNKTNVAIQSGFKIAFDAKINIYHKYDNELMDIVYNYGLTNIKKIQILKKYTFKRHFRQNIYNKQFAYILSSQNGRFTLLYLSNHRYYPKEKQKYYKRIANVKLRIPTQGVFFTYIIPKICTVGVSCFSEPKKIKFSKKDGSTIRDIVKKNP